MNYINARRMENAVVSLARRMGIDGDPFAENVQPVGQRWEEAAIREIYLDVRPRPHTDEEKALTWKLARAVVMSRSPELRPMQHFTMESAVHDYIDGELAGHEVPETRQTWHRDPTPDRIKRARSAAR